MLVNLSFVVAEARGKLEDKIYCRNQGGNYIRSFVPPTYKNTTHQQRVRNEFKRLSKKWATLTEAERLSWISGAPNFKRTNVFGSVKQLDGKALYQSLNMNLFLIGKTDRVICPAPVSMPTPTIAYLNTGVTTPFRLYLKNVPNTTILIEGTPMLSPAINFFTKYFKLFHTAEISGGINPPLKVAYLARFSTITTGQKVAIRVTAINQTTGQRGSPQIISGIMTA